MNKNASLKGNTERNIILTNYNIAFEELNKDEDTKLSNRDITQFSSNIGFYKGTMKIYDEKGVKVIPPKSVFTNLEVKMLVRY